MAGCSKGGQDTGQRNADTFGKQLIYTKYEEYVQKEKKKVGRKQIDIVVTIRVDRQVPSSVELLHHTRIFARKYADPIR